MTPEQIQRVRSSFAKMATIQGQAAAIQAGMKRIAEQNRALHGRSKAGKARDAEAERKSQTFVEGHRRERPAGDGDA